MWLLQVRGDVHLTTPRIDEVLTKFRQRTSSEVPAPVTQPQPQSSQSSHNVRPTVAEAGDTMNEERIKKLEQQVYQLIKKVQIQHCWQ